MSVCAVCLSAFLQSAAWRCDHLRFLVTLKKKAFFKTCSCPPTCTIMPTQERTTDACTHKYKRKHSCTHTHTLADPVSYCLCSSHTYKHTVLSCCQTVRWDGCDIGQYASQVSVNTSPSPSPSWASSVSTVWIYGQWESVWSREVKSVNTEL